MCGRTRVTGGKETDKESAKSHFQFTTEWPRDADAYLNEVIKSLTSLLRHGERSPTLTHCQRPIPDGTHTSRWAVSFFLLQIGQ